MRKVAGFIRPERLPNCTKQFNLGFLSRSLLAGYEFYLMILGVLGMRISTTKKSNFPDLKNFPLPVERGADPMVEHFIR